MWMIWASGQWRPFWIQRFTPRLHRLPPLPLLQPPEKKRNKNINFFIHDIEQQYK